MSNEDKDLKIEDIADRWVKIVLEQLKANNQQLIMIVENKEEHE